MCAIQADATSWMSAHDIILVHVQTHAPVTVATVMVTPVKTPQDVMSHKFADPDSKHGSNTIETPGGGMSYWSYWVAKN